MLVVSCGGENAVIYKDEARNGLEQREDGEHAGCQCDYLRVGGEDKRDPTSGDHDDNPKQRSRNKS